MILREFIKGVLAEAALGINDMADDHYVLIARRGQGLKVELRVMGDHKHLGQLILRGPADDCIGAYVIRSSSATSGWGPFLYDIAMEWATMYGNGLAPDRSLVSTDARRVWDFYSKNRPDVKQIQMDDPENTLTPTDDDNCSQIAAMKGFEDTDDGFVKSPLSKRYTKEPTTINALKKLRKLRVEDF